MSKRIDQKLWDWSRAERGFGELMSAARKARGLTQLELAARLGVSNGNISRIEHGADLRLSTLVELARELQLEPMLVPVERVSAVRALLDSFGADADIAQRPRFA